MSNAVHPEFRQSLRRLTREIAKVCDYASKLDYQGFSKWDREKGHGVAIFGLEEWDAFWVRRWAQRLYKYRVQLGGVEKFLTRLFEGSFEGEIT